ncbi:MAG: hypothetical protein WC100_06920 [Sterolibacterium sp.]
MSVEVAEAVRGRASIAVNTTFKLAPWADVLYWTDNAWFEPRLQDAMGFAGLKVTSNRHSWKHNPNEINLIKTEQYKSFFPRSGNVRQGRTSGHTAICLAISMGAKEVILLGYDMRVADDGREHHHNEYAGQNRQLEVYKRDFLPAFAHWNEQALGDGVRILNATPGSAIEEFEMVSLDEVL